MPSIIFALFCISCSIHCSQSPFNYQLDNKNNKSNNNTAKNNLTAYITEFIAAQIGATIGGFLVVTIIESTLGGTTGEKTENVMVQKGQVMGSWIAKKVAKKGIKGAKEGTIIGAASVVGDIAGHKLGAKINKAEEGRILVECIGRQAAISGFDEGAAGILKGTIIGSIEGTSTVAGKKLGTTLEAKYKLGANLVSQFDLCLPSVYQHLELHLGLNPNMDLGQEKCRLDLENILPDQCSSLGAQAGEMLGTQIVEMAEKAYNNRNSTRRNELELTNATK